MTITPILLLLLLLLYLLLLLLLLILLLVIITILVTTSSTRLDSSCYYCYTWLRRLCRGALFFCGLEFGDVGVSGTCLRM